MTSCQWSLLNDFDLLSIGHFSQRKCGERANGCFVLGSVDDVLNTAYQMPLHKLSLLKQTLQPRAALDMITLGLHIVGQAIAHGMSVLHI